MKQTGGVCLYSERPDVALELLAAARPLAGDGPVVAVVVGTNPERTAGEQLSRGADHAYIVDAPGLDALRHVQARREPDIVLVGATAHGTEVASRLAQGLGVGCASECTRLDLEEGRLVIERTCLGRFIERQRIDTHPAIATVQPRRFEPPRPAAVDGKQPERLRIDARPAGPEIVETRQRAVSGTRIDRAEIVVGVGRGLKSEADLAMIEDLARALGGVVGASRPLTDDLQWLHPDRKIGLSGVTVKPKLYIAVGISGQIEHNVGMRESDVVVAINKDPTAPIMQQADYCVAGDLYEVVPALIDAVRRIAVSSDGYS